MGIVREEISKNLLFYRKKCGLTQKELAQKIGVGVSAVSNWEKGANSIDIETLFEVCKIYGISINDMYGKFSNEPTKPSEEVQELLLLIKRLDSADLRLIKSEANLLLKTEKYSNETAVKMA